MRTSIRLWPILLLAACATPMPTVTDTSNSALLRYVNTGEAGYTVLTRVNVANCPNEPALERVADTGPGALLLNSARETSTLEMLGTKSGAQAHIRERRIPAGRNFVYQLSSGTVAVQYSPGFSCDHAGAFPVLAGEQYELAYDIGYLGKNCKVQVWHLRADGQGGVARDPVENHKIFYPPKDAGAYCQYM